VAGPGPQDPEADHRLVYKIAADEIRIAACRYHYER
jgi:Txe/YoeB family toxin of Txe-Axe toxin-antitoxin module